MCCCCSQSSITNASEKLTVRFATFNVSMNRGSSGKLLAELQAGESEQIKKVAAVIRIVRPDIILLNEFDYCGDQAATAIAAFQENFLAVKELLGTKPITFKYHFVSSVNTGLPSGLDLDGTVNHRPWGRLWVWPLSRAIRYGCVESVSNFLGRQNVSEFPLERHASSNAASEG